MKLNVLKGQTSKLIQVFIQDSSSTTGAGLTGLLYNTSSLSAYYYREGAASATAITLADMTVGTWTSGGFKAVDGTNMPGVYQVGIPDAALASGANSVVIMLKGAANMAPVVLEIQLVSFDPNDAAALGLSRLDAAITSRLAPTTSGRTLDVTATGEAGIDWSNIGAPTTSVNLSGTTISTSQAVASVSGAVGSVTGNIGGNVTGSIGSLATQAKADVNAEADTALADVGLTTTITGRIDAAISTRSSHTAAQTAAAVWDYLTSAATTAGSLGKLLVDNIDAAISSRLSTASYTAPLGAAGVRTAIGLASANLDTQLSGISTKTDNLPATPAATGDAMTLASGAITAAVVATGAIDADALATDAVNEIADGILDRNLATGTDSNSRSLRNAIRFLRNKWSISSTTLTVTKEDDSTTAWTASLTTSASADPVTGSDPS